MLGIWGAVSALKYLTESPANLHVQSCFGSRAANTEPHRNTRDMHSMVRRQHVTGIGSQIWEVHFADAMTSHTRPAFIFLKIYNVSYGASVMLLFNWFLNVIAYSIKHFTSGIMQLLLCLSVLLKKIPNNAENTYKKDNVMYTKTTI